ncbi:glutamine cyclotransferase [Castellaniella sp. GW247-6E4]|uniref:Vgb family protein n=1 Tax=Castellaniella sp. GW247-6E4 TaxID=3140380 RepID=UPI003315A394
MKNSRADILREYGPFPGVDSVHGVSFDGRKIWFAAGDRLHALDPDSGSIVDTLDVAADAGTAFDGKHLFQIAGTVIRKIDPLTGQTLGMIPAPGHGDASGLAWAEGALWVGLHRGHRIFQVDPDTGSVLRSIECSRFVTGVTWVDGELWHATWQDGASDIRRIDPATGDVQERIEMPAGIDVSGLESDAGDRFFCGGGNEGTLKAVRRGPRG